MSVEDVVSAVGHSGMLNYVFESDKLVIAQYNFDDDDDMTTEILGILTGKHGQPADSGDIIVHWKLARTYIGLSFKDNLRRVDYADQGCVADAKDKGKAEYDLLF
jgi:hypothetical protein